MTTPVSDLLPLPIDAKASGFMQLYHDAIHEIVCFGTHVLAWNLEQGKGKQTDRNEIDLAVPLFFRHTLELLDAIAVQLEKGIAVPCKVQLRAVLEAYLGLEYLLEKERKRRAACFLITDHYRKLNFYKQLIPNTVENTQLTENLNKYGFIIKALSPIKDALKGHNNQLKLIEMPIYEEARNEYKRLTNNNCRNLHIKWYTLYGGPRTVLDLAKHLGKYDLYEFYYKAWSNSIHGTDLSTNVLVKGDDGLGAIIQLRNMQEAQSIASQSIAFGKLIITLMINKAVPEHKADYARWLLGYKVAFGDPVDQTA